VATTFKSQRSCRGKQARPWKKKATQLAKKAQGGTKDVKVKPHEKQVNKLTFVI